MVLPSTQTVDLRTHLQKGAIYRDRSNNAIRLLSICGDYCVYVYVSLTGLRSSMHGSVTGLTRRDVFGASFVFVAGSVKDWMGNQRNHNASTPSFGIVPYSSSDSRRPFKEPSAATCTALRLGASALASVRARERSERKPATPASVMRGRRNLSQTRKAADSAGSEFLPATAS